MIPKKIKMRQAVKVTFSNAIKIGMTSFARGKGHSSATSDLISQNDAVLVAGTDVGYCKAPVIVTVKFNVSNRQKLKMIV